MSSTSHPLPLATAQQGAAIILERLRPTCQRVHVCGSIRRAELMVNDIEIVCQPLLKTVTQEALFEGDQVTAQEVDPAFIAVVSSLGEIKRGQFTGRYMQIIRPGTGIKIDLFMPQPHDYWRQVAIRTGNADYARARIATAWSRKGWVGTPDGLRLLKQCKQLKSGSYVCEHPTPTLPPEWQSEEEFFQWIGLTYISPSLRKITS